MVSTAQLSEFGLFKDLPEEFLGKLAAISHEFGVLKDNYIFREGEKADQLHFLVEGGVSLRVKLTSRPDHVTVSFINKPYESFGWSGVVAPYHYTASAYCEDDSQILVMPAKEFMQALERDPKSGFIVMQRITEIIADRLRNSRQALLKTM
jgi:CRP/FNR family transcriptional activator FtrB